MLQLAFTLVVYPSLVLAYMGQAAYLSQHHDLDNDHRIGFYVSVPGTLVVIITFSFRESICEIPRRLERGTKHSL